MDDYVSMLTVSRLAGLLKDLVEENFAQVLVEGEISNLSVPASGHFYFSLKDDSAQVRAVMFRSQARLLPFRPENGMQVVLSGRVSLYPQRGEVQLVAELLEPRGVGNLQLAFEQLKRRLDGEGLFAEAGKRPLPKFPRTVGVVTSATGAAIHDIVNVLRRRGAGLKILLRPVRVQGEGAAAEIAQAIADQNRFGVADVLIVGRGGGSLEDLWAFNEEAVARAIRASNIPVISAVGHEIDYTIADFAADLRAPTPSAAAELVARSRLEMEEHLDHLSRRLGAEMQGCLRLLDERARGLTLRLRSPRQQLQLWQQRHDDLLRRLDRSMMRCRQDAQGELAALAGRLDLLSPLRTLERGYAAAFAEKTGRAVLDARSLMPGDRLRLRFARGTARATIDETGE